MHSRERCILLTQLVSKGCIAAPRGGADGARGPGQGSDEEGAGRGPANAWARRGGAAAGSFPGFAGFNTGASRSPRFVKSRMK
jgi:hypothetical protein